MSAGQQVGKFGGAEDEQKEENSASSLGSEKFLLASSQIEVPSAKLQKLAHVVVTLLGARNSALQKIKATGRQRPRILHAKGEIKKCSYCFSYFLVSLIPRSSCNTFNIISDFITE